MANIFRTSKNLFCAVTLCIALLSAAEGSAPLRKSIPNRSRPIASKSERKKRNNPNAQRVTSTHTSTSSEHLQSLYSAEVTAEIELLCQRLKELAEQMFATDKYLFEQMVKEDVFRDEDFTGRIKYFSRVYANNQTLTAGILEKRYIEAGNMYNDDFSTFFVVTSNHKAKLTYNFYVGAKASDVSFLLKKALKKASGFNEEAGRIYILLYENQYITEFIDIRHNGKTITQIGYCEIPKSAMTKAMDMPDLKDTWIFIQNKAKAIGLTMLPIETM